MAKKKSASGKKQRGELDELALLYEISQLLDRSLDLGKVAEPLMDLIAAHTGMLHGMLTLLNRQSGEASIQAGHGLSRSQRERGKYRRGEGVVGKVVQTGRSVVVPRVSDEPEFLDRTGALRKQSKRDVSFICVPIKVGTEVVGTLSADRLFAEQVALNEDLRLLTIITSMIAQAVKLRQAVEEERHRLQEENERLQGELRERFRPDNIIGNSKAMQAVFDTIAQVAQSDATVLVRGESGTGKELVAHAIHHASRRLNKPYVKVNCAALPETILEAELFGHEKGAFTGAIARRKGRFELAQAGTLFLDEVGDFSAATQVKLLRVIQEREYELVGGIETHKADVRIIAATNRDLEDLVARGQFREDLYYRLNVFPVHLPPLRDRKSDILLLADHFVAKYSEANGKNVKRISTPAIDMMMAYHWPGNVRELENCIERAILLTNDGVIHGNHLPPTLQTAEASGTVIRETLEAAVERLEREMIIDTLKTAGGNCSRAASMLAVTERILGLRLARYDIDYRRFRRGGASSP